MMRVLTVMVFMFGELYEDEAESLSATPFDPGTKEDAEMPSEATEAEKIYFRYHRAKHQ